MNMHSWMGYGLRRLAVLPIILLTISLIAFTLVRLVPIEPAEVILQVLNIPATEEQLQLTRAELGMDKPYLEQYGQWLWRAVHLDFGVSYMNKKPVWESIVGKIPATLQLTGSALVVALMFSIPLGVWAALRKNRFVDQLSRLQAIAGASLPRFWLGFLLIYLFSLKLDWFPSHGRGGWMHFVLPVMTLAFSQIAVYSRLLRVSVLETMQEPHVLYARMRGLSERVVVWRHIVRNSLSPLISVVGISAGNLLAGSVVVEQVFGWPGLGRYLIESILSRDYPVVQCYVLLMAFFFFTFHLLVDVLQKGLDPRIGRRRGEGGA